MRALEARTEYLTYEYSLAEDHIYSSLMYLLLQEPYFEYRYRIYDYFKKYIARENPLGFLNSGEWDRTPESLDYLLSKVSDAVGKIKNYQILNTKRDLGQFIYWYLQSNIALVDVELAANAKHPLSSEQGVEWIFDQLNRHRRSKVKLSFPVNEKATTTDKND